MDGQADMMKLIAAFQNFANAHKNQTWLSRKEIKRWYDTAQLKSLRNKSLQL